MMSLPGFRFRPSVKELIGVLEIMARGGDKVDVSQLTETPGDISSKQLYGEVDKEPWKILSNPNEWELYDVADTGKKKATYVVTRLPIMGGNKVARKAGNGTWMGQTQPTMFEKDGEEVAFMKSLSYVYTGPTSEAEDKCYFYMHEYYLSKTYLKKIRAKFTDHVICRIIKDSSKNCRCGRNGSNKRRRVSSSGTKNEENPSSETLVYQETPVYYSYPEFTGNPSSFGLSANDHNQEVQDLQEPPPCNNYYHSEFTVNPSGLWVDGYNPDGSTVTEQQYPPVYNLEELTAGNPNSLVPQEVQIGSCMNDHDPILHQEHMISSMMMQTHQDSGEPLVPDAPAQPLPPPPVSNEGSFEIIAGNPSSLVHEEALDYTFDEFLEDPLGLHQEYMSSMMMQPPVVPDAPAQPLPPPVSNESGFGISSRNEDFMDPDPEFLKMLKEYFGLLKKQASRYVVPDAPAQPLPPPVLNESSFGISSRNEDFMGLDPDILKMMEDTFGYRCIA